MIRIKTTNSTSKVSDICVYQMVKNKIKITWKCKDWGQIISDNVIKNQNWRWACRQINLYEGTDVKVETIDGLTENNQ